MVKEYNGPVLDPEFKSIVESGRDVVYSVMVGVQYDGETFESGFEGNKGKLEQFLSKNDGIINTPINLIPTMNVQLNGHQIIRLSEQDYIRYIMDGSERAEISQPIPSNENL